MPRYTRATYKSIFCHATAGHPLDSMGLDFVAALTRQTLRIFTDNGCIIVRREFLRGQRLFGVRSEPNCYLGNAARLPQQKGQCVVQTCQPCILLRSRTRQKETSALDGRSRSACLSNNFIPRWQMQGASPNRRKSGTRHTQTRLQDDYFIPSPNTWIREVFVGRDETAVTPQRRGLPQQAASRCRAQNCVNAVSVRRPLRKVVTVTWIPSSGRILPRHLCYNLMQNARCLTKKR